MAKSTAAMNGPVWKAAFFLFGVTAGIWLERVMNHFFPRRW